MFLLIKTKDKTVEDDGRMSGKGGDDVFSGGGASGGDGGVLTFPFL